MTPTKNFFSHEVRVGLALFAGVLIVVLTIMSIGEQVCPGLKGFRQEHLYD